MSNSQIKNLNVPYTQKIYWILLGIKEVYIKTRCHFVLIRLAKYRKVDYLKCWWGSGTVGSHTLLLGVKISAISLESNWHPLWHRTWQLHSRYTLCVCTKRHVCGLFSCRKWKEFKCPSAGNMVGYIACSYKQLND